jgi:hypothetical protein
VGLHLDPQPVALRPFPLPFPPLDEALGASDPDGGKMEEEEVEEEEGKEGEKEEEEEEEQERGEEGEDGEMESVFEQEGRGA